MKNFWTVLKTLGVALASGVLAQVADSVATTGKIDVAHLKVAAIAGALTTAGAFLKSSPLAPAPPAQSDPLASKE